MKALDPARSPSPLSLLLREAGNKGFALVATLLLMSLLSVLAMGVLSLGNVALRSTHANEARRVAQANARVALSLALGQLQSELGDDRRVTADGSVLGSAVGQPGLTGVWDSAAGNQTSLPTAKAPDYNVWKEEKFRTWLASGPNRNLLRQRKFAIQHASEDAPKLFSEKTDGFEMRAETIPVATVDGMRGSVAWAVSQEATKARINLGSQQPRYAANDEIQAPAGPNLALSGLASQPDADWARRAGRLLGMRQAILDPDLALDPNKAALLGKEHTAQSRGVLADVVKGGLKTDLSLAFDLNDNDFKASRWGYVSNPFGSGGAPSGETPLYNPLNGGAPVKLTMNYSPVVYDHIFETGAPPTFNSLRSYYNLYRHLYSSNGTATAFYRPQASSYWPNNNTRGSETSVSPVLDRVLFFIGLYVDKTGILNVTFTPVITLWNPYNVAVESEGFVVYPWMDIPLFTTFNINGSNTPSIPLSYVMGIGKVAGEGRQAEPYFHCYLTGSGAENTNTPIRLGPGEVRVFVPASKTLTPYIRTAPADARSHLTMKPVSETSDMDIGGGFSVPMNNSLSGPGLTRVIQKTDSITTTLDFQRKKFHYFVTMEDAGRIKGLAKGKTVAEVQLYSGLGDQQFVAPLLTGGQLQAKPEPIALLETYHRTAGQAGQMADLVYTVNPRQRYINAMISGSSTFASGPHYDSSMRLVRDYISPAFQVTGDGRRSYYGSSNASGTGRDFLSFFEVPQDPMMSLGAFQNADLSDSAFSSGTQFGNSWASGFVARNSTGRILKNASTSGSERIEQNGLGLYDHSYLVNAAIWDGYYFSSISPRTTLAPAEPSPAVYGYEPALVRSSSKEIIRNWVADPEANPLRNPRHVLHKGDMTGDKIVDLLASPSGCRYAAAFMMLDGAFNVNSTNEAAWRAMLSSLRGHTFDVESSSGPSKSYNPGDSTPVPRLRRPSGSSGDLWNGFRELSDDQIRALAREIVTEVRSRGPFQSMGEFVNRRLDNTDLGLKGALQAAIDRAGINKDSMVAKFDTSGYPYRNNIRDPYTGTGTPGWLTQADLLNGLAPFITVRSDTFTIRAYGEAKDKDDNILARSWCEAVVQRVPEWLDPDPSDNATELPQDLTPLNARFGRRFEILSFRELSNQEIDI